MTRHITDRENGKYEVEIADDPSRRISVEIGDTKQVEFYPQIKTLLWDNECNFSVRLAGDHSGANVSKQADKIEFGKGDRTVRFYDLATEDEHGGFEFEVEFAAQPASNIVEFSIETKDLVFEYQPALTAEEIRAGDVRPENVVGSYAVYHANRANNKAGAKHYKTGKAFHIYRPFAIDANHSRVWCELSIDAQAGTLSITVPQDFLEKAVYPVIVDPTLGYTSWGASNATRTANGMFTYRAVAIDSGTVDSISIGADGNGSTTNCKGVLYQYDATTNVILTDGVTPASTFPGSAGGSPTTINYSSGPLIVSGTEYAIGGISDSVPRYYYDSGSGTVGFFHSNNYATPTDASFVTGTSRRVSNYLTYTAGGSFTGTGVQDTSPAEQASSGALSYTGTSEQTAGAANQQATGGQALSGTIAATTAAATQDGSGALAFVGTSAQDAAAAEQAASGELPYTGSAVQTTSAATQEASGTNQFSHTGTAAMDAAAAIQALLGSNVVGNQDPLGAFRADSIAFSYLATASLFSFIATEEGRDMRSTDFEKATYEKFAIDFDFTDRWPTTATEIQSGTVTAMGYAYPLST